MQTTTKPTIDWAQIMAAYEENTRAIRAIARDFKVSETAIRKKAKALGLVRGSHQDEFARTNVTTEKLVADLRSAGVADDVIADGLIVHAAALWAATGGGSPRDARLFIERWTEIRDEALSRPQCDLDTLVGLSDGDDATHKVIQ